MSNVRRTLIMEGRIVPKLPAQHPEEVIFTVGTQMVYVGREAHYDLARLEGEHVVRLERTEAETLIKWVNASAAEKKDPNETLDVEEPIPNAAGEVREHVRSVAFPPTAGPRSATLLR